MRTTLLRAAQSWRARLLLIAIVITGLLTFASAGFAVTVDAITPTWTATQGSSGAPTCQVINNGATQADVFFGDTDLTSPPCPGTSQQSGLTFASGPTGATYADGQPFLLGQLTHTNRQVFGASQLTQATLQLNFTSTSPVTPLPITTNVSLVETPNNLQTCPFGDSAPCADQFTIAPAVQPFSDAGQNYQIEILGLIPGSAPGCAYSEGALVMSIISDEDTATSACVFGRVKQITDARLEISKTTTVTALVPNAVVEYQIDYSCASTTAACNNVVLTDFLPPELTYISSTGSIHTIGATGIYNASNRSVRFNFIEPLPAGSTGFVTIQARVSNTGAIADGQPITNTATSTLTNGQTSTSTVTTPASAISNWDVQKSGDAIAYISSEPPITDMHYTVQICPAGSTVNLLNATMVDTLPPGAVFVGATGGGTYDSLANTVTWSLGELSINGGCVSRQVTVRYPNPPFAAGNVVTNVVTGSGTIVGGAPWTDTANLPRTLQNFVPNPSMTMDKGATRTDYVIGAQVDYSLTPRNTGNTNLYNLVMTDNLPASLRLSQVVLGGSPYPITLEYALNGSGTYVTWGSFPANSNTTLNVSSLGLLPTDWVTSLRWRFNPGSGTPPGWTLNPSAHIIGTLTSPDRLGNTVADGSQIINNASIAWEYLPGGAGTCASPNAICGTGTDGADITIVPVPVPVFDKTSGGGAASGQNFIIGQQVGYFDLNVDNNTGIAVDNFTLTDDLPVQFGVTSVNVGSFAAWSGTIGVRYQISSNPGVWQIWPGSPFAEGTALNVSGLGLPGGVYISRLEFSYGTIPAAFAGAPRIFGATLATGWDGVPVADGNTMVNNAQMSWTYLGGPNSRTDTTSDPIRQPTVTPSASKTVTSAGPYIPTSAVSYRLAIGAAGNSPSTVMNNPFAADLLPLNMNYVGFTYDDNGTGLPAPVLTQIPNYNGTGRMLLRWAFTGTLQRGQSVYINLNTTLSAGTAAGPLNNTLAVTVDDMPVNSSTTEPFDTNGDGDSNDRVVTSSTTVTVAPLVGLDSTKAVRGALDTGFSVFPAYGNTLPNGSVDYRLNVVNRGNVSINNVRVIDILPFVGDTGVRDLRPRNSAWQPLLDGPVTPQAGVTIYYSTSGNPCRPEVVSSGPPGCTAANWSLVPPANITSVRSLRFDFAGTLVPGQSFSFQWRMRAPATGTDQSIAWNSFAYSSTNAQTGVPLFPAEPNKVGIIYNNTPPDAQIDIEKYTNGDDADLPTGPLIATNGTVTWTYVVTNTGPTRLDNIAVTDDVEGAITCPQTTLLAGASMTCTRTDTTPQAGQYANLADVIGTAVDVNGIPIDADGDASNGLQLLQPTDSDPSHYYGYDPLLARLGNYTWIDLDYDGIQDAVEPPLGGVTVRLLDSAGGPVDDPLQPGFQPYVTTSNAAGLYTFANLAAGDYIVAFEVPSAYSLTLPDQSGDAADSDADPTAGANYGRSPVVSLTAGEYNDTIDAGFIAFASLGDRIWYDMDGDGVQDVSETLTNGLGGLPVELMDSTGTIVKATTYTNPGGIYVFSDLLPGQYRVRFPAAPANYLWTTANAGGDDALDSDADVVTRLTPVITLAAGENQPTWDAGLVPVATIGDYVWYDNDLDGIQDSGEPGVPNVTVRLLDAAGNQATRDDGSLIPDVQTDANGLYRFSNLRPGQYEVRFTRPSGTIFTDDNAAGSTDSNDSDAIESGANIGRTALTTLTPASLDTRWDAGLIRLSSLGNFVWQDDNDNGQQDGGEPGVAGVTVTLLNSAGTPVTVDALGNAISQIVTTGTGAYSFTNLDPRIQYIVQFERPTTYVFATPNSGSDTTDSDAAPSNLLPLGTGRTGVITLPAGVNNDTIDAGLLQVAAIGNYVWYDDDNDGQQTVGEPPASGVTVRLLNSAGNQATDERGTLIPDQVTPASGLYNFVNLRPGTYSLAFSTLPSTYTFARRDIGADASDSDPNRFTGRTATTVLSPNEIDDTWDAGLVVAAALGNFVWLDLDADGVQDGGSEVGLNNVQVQLLDGSNNPIDNPNTPAIGDAYTATTNASGVYSFVGLPPNETYRVRFIRPGGYVLTRSNQGANDAVDSDGLFNGQPNAANATTGDINTLTPGSTDNDWDQGMLLPSALGNRVWSDNNDDGLQTSGEPGIDGATVRLLDSLGNPVDDPNTAGVSAYVVTTSGGGVYAFTNLYPGQYIIQFDTPAAAPGYIRSFYNVGGVAASDTDSNNQTSGPDAGRTTLITLPYNTTDNTWDAGFVPLASIGDRVWSDSNDNGIQDTGEPGLNGVTVNLLNSDGTPVTLDAYGSTIPAVTTTTATVGGVVGTYRFSNLNPRLDYIVEFVRPADYKRSPADVNTGGGTEANDSDASLTDGRTAVIAVNPGDTITTVDAGFTPLGRIGDRVWIDTNGNGQQNGGELGLNGVTVTLLDGSNNPVTTDGLGNAIGPITTINNPVGGAPGYYQFSNLNAGDYVVEFALPSGYVFTRANTGSDNTDSDANRFTGRTGTYTLGWGTSTQTVDAGIVQPASLGDYVWYDTNNNGRQDDGPNATVGSGVNGGINGVVVRLLDGSNNPVDNPNTPAANDAYVLTTADDGSGNPGYYLFTGLLPGTYRVRFDVPGSTLPLGSSNYVLALANVGPGDLLDSDPDRFTGITGDYPLTAGQVNITADAGIQLLGARLGNRVWIDINNNGLQDAGETGLDGVTVTLLNNSGGADIDPITPGVQTRSTTTSTDATEGPGWYQFTDLVPGPYIVEVTLPTGYQFSPVDAGSDDTIDSDVSITTGRTTLIPLLPYGDDQTWDAGLVPLARIGDRVWRDANDNGVQDGGETGVAGVTVNLRDSTGTTILRTTTTDPSGNYRFIDLPPDTSYLIEFVRPAGYLFSQQDAGAATDASDSDANTSTGRTIATLLSPGEDDTTWDAGLVPLAALGDQVWRDDDGDGVQDGGEPGLAGVTVTLYDSTGTQVTTDGNGNAISPVVTTGSGVYSFTNLNPRIDYRVGFSLPAGYVRSPANQGGDDTLDSDADVSTGLTGVIPLDPGQNDTTWDAGYAPLGSLGNFIWNDLDGDGIQDGGAETGIAGAIVTLLDGSGNAVIADALGNAISPVTTTGSGAYLFSNLPSGTYRIQVTPPAGYVLTLQDQGGSDAADSDIDRYTFFSASTLLDWGETDLTLDAGVLQPAALGNYVWEDLNYDGQQDEPASSGLNGVTVRLLDSAGNPADNPNTAAADVYEVTTADDAGNPGYYAFTGLIPGSYRVQFVPPTGAQITQPNIGVDISDSDAADSGPSLGVTGTVTLAAGATDNTVDAGLFRYASLGDRVWIDLNNNGVQDSGESGYDGAIVTLYTGAGVQVGLPAITDSSGNYRFDTLTPGDYYVVVTLPAGYQYSEQNAAGSTAANDSDADISNGRMATTTLISGENDLTWDAGLVPLASIGDRVWNDIDGDGVQESGETGVGGVTVNLLNSGGTVIATTTTDANGGYGFINLPPGDYALEFIAPAGFIFTRANQGTDDTADSDANRFSGRTVTTTLAPDEDDMTWDAGILRPAAIGDYVWEDLNDNGQQDEPASSGLNNVTVRLLDSSGQPVDNPNTATVGDAYVVTTANNGGNPGYYAFTGLFPGDYIVAFELPGSQWAYARLDQGADATDSDANRTSGRSGIVTLIAGQTDDTVDAGLLQRATIGNHVWIDLDNDGVQDVGESGFSGATVRLYDGTGAFVAQSVTNSSGDYTFTELIPGEYAVEVVLPTGYQFSPADAGSPNDDALDSDADITTGRMPVTVLTSGEVDNTWDAGLVPLASIGDRVWVDADGDGLQTPGEVGLGGVTVSLYRAGDTTPYRTTTSSSAAGTLGAYVFDLLPPGDYFLEFTLPSGYLFTNADAGDDALDSDPNILSGRTAITTLSPDEDDTSWDAGLLPLGQIGDRVWRDSNRNGIFDSGEQPIPGVTVILTRPNNTPLTTVTDANGLYRFIDLPAGTYTVRIDPATVPPSYAQTYDLDGVLDNQASYTLGIGEIVLTLDFGYAPPDDPPYIMPTNTPAPTPTSAREPRLVGGGSVLGPICARGCVPIVTYVSNINGNWDIYRLVEGGEDVNLTDNPANDTQMSYSPDGRYMVFVSDRDGNPEIYVQPIDGGSGSAQRVTYNTVAIESDPVWGPGNFIAYVSSRSGNFELYVFNVLTGRETRVTFNEASDLSPSWTPDGQLIYQSDISGQWQIYQADVETGAVRLLSDGQGDDLDPIMSPDGSRLAYRSLRQTPGSDAEPNSVLYIANADGSAPMAISDPLTNAVNPTWSPDGRQLAYQSDLNGNLDVFAYNVGSGTTEQVSEGLVDEFAPIYRCDRDTVLFSSNSFNSAVVFEDVPRSDEIALSPDEDSLNYVAESSVQVYLLGNQQKQFAGNEGVLPSGPDATGGQTAYTFPVLDIIRDPLATDNQDIPFDPFAVCEAP